MRRAPRYRASIFSATAASKSKSGAAAGAGCWLIAANARPFGCTGATRGASIVSIEFLNVEQRRFSPGGHTGLTPSPPPLQPGEAVVAEADGVVLGWQARTILIWWLPGMIFVALAWLETRSPAVTAGLAAFCVGLFLFYSFDREVRPRSRRRRYVLTERRRLIASAAGPPPRPPRHIADGAVGRLSGAATIVLQLRLPGPKGEPRTLRIGPMRRPGDFRRSIDAQLDQAPAGGAPQPTV